MHYRVKGCRYKQNNKTQRPNPPEHSLTFRSTSTSSPQVCKSWQQEQKGNNAICSAQHQAQRPTDAVNINSVGCIQLYFRLDWACGRTCKVEKGLGPLHRQQKFLWSPRSLPKQSDLIMAKSWIRFWCEPAGKLLEMLQSCLNFARQELPLCGTCNYQPCAQQEGIMARMKWVPNACFKLYAFKALMRVLWAWNKLAKIPT